MRGIDDNVTVMPSLQRPKKLVFIGTDGKSYPFLCKPHDDLRKDARLMDFNSMINKLLKSASESRRRQLCRCERPTADRRYQDVCGDGFERGMWSA
jgi:serine/threonine-protein kinase ATR